MGFTFNKTEEVVPLRIRQEATLREVHCAKDTARVDLVLNRPAKTPINIPDFYKMIMDPLQGACESIMKMGVGHWWLSGFDGHKYVCLDDLMDRGNEIKP